MIDDVALGINTTNSWTRIATTVVEAGLTRHTVRVTGTLGPTGNVWIAYVIRPASARACVTVDPTLRV